MAGEGAPAHAFAETAVASAAQRAIRRIIPARLAPAVALGHDG
jgi:hypothetical protein